MRSDSGRTDYLWPVTAQLRAPAPLTENLREFASLYPGLELVV